MTLTMHRLPAGIVGAELKMLSSGVVAVDGSSVGSGAFMTLKERDAVSHWFSVKTIVRFCPAGVETSSS